MSFDTTYIYQSPDGHRTWQRIIPGGKNKKVTVKEGDSLYEVLNPQFTDSVINAVMEQLPQPEKQQYAETDYAPFVFFSLLFGFVMLRFVKEKNQQRYSKAAGSSKIEHTPYLTYHGDNLNFTDAEVTAVLQKHFPYFNKLSILEKEKFIDRTQLFIADKVFKIHCNPGFKEMPILISASAVQLTFGLKKFLLPNFTFIHVYPQEFIGVHPTLRVLEGNVSGHAINLSWKHFLEGYKNSANGQNVGLHELAHALYYQTFVVEENVDRNFRDTFDAFSEYGNKAFETEQDNGNKLYSSYALKSFQEFWAESMEIFFEKPWELKAAYPHLYNALTGLLNQDPSINTPQPRFFKMHSQNLTAVAAIYQSI